MQNLKIKSTVSYPSGPLFIKLFTVDRVTFCRNGTDFRNLRFVKHDHTFYYGSENHPIY